MASGSVKCITVVMGSGGSIGLHGHVGKAAKEGAEQIQYQERGVPGDDECEPN
jgi:hypothetical protein